MPSAKAPGSLSSKAVHDRQKKEYSNQHSSQARTTGLFLSKEGNRASHAPCARTIDGADGTADVRIPS